MTTTNTRSIACGACRGRHETVADVRACSAAQNVARAAGTPTALKAGATARQVAFIQDLCSDVGTTSADLLGGHHPDSLTKQEASKLIDRLITMRSERKAEAKVNDPETTTTADDPVPVGTYTLCRPDGTYRTLQFVHPKWADGKFVAHYLSGSDNTADYTPFAFVNGGKVRVFKKFADNAQLREDLETFLACEVESPGDAHERFLEHAEAFALRSGKCMRCGRKLTVKASLFRGLGPKCAGIEGV